VNRELLKHADWWGIVYSSVGFSLLYAGLDQGNRLDWLHSGLITGLLLGGGLLLIAFVVQELTSRRPWIDLRYAAAGNLPLLFLLVTFFRFSILATSYVIPQYLITVQGFRAIEVGGVLVWIALPQFVLAPLVATLLRNVEPRFPLALGFALVACACFMAAQLTHDWVGVDFLPSQVIQAIGQSLGLTSLVWFFLKHLDPSQIFTFGAVLQTGRLFGAELGSAFVQTFTRVREQVYSNLVGLHVMAGAPDTTQRLQEYAQGVAGRSVGVPQANARAAALLAHSVQIQASVR
jgi:DHA2 family multidrug resistance protein